MPLIKKNKMLDTEYFAFSHCDILNNVIVTIFTYGIFTMWHFYHLPFLPSDICSACGIFTIWHFLPSGVFTIWHL